MYEHRDSDTSDERELPSSGPSRTFRSMNGHDHSLPLPAVGAPQWPAAGRLSRAAASVYLLSGGVVAALGAVLPSGPGTDALVVAAWLFWRDSPPAWQRWWLLVIVVGGEFAWGITPLPVLIGVAGWLAFLVAPPAPVPKPALASA